MQVRAENSQPFMPSVASSWPADFRKGIVHRRMAVPPSASDTRHDHLRLAKEVYSGADWLIGADNRRLERSAQVTRALNIRSVTFGALWRMIALIIDNIADENYG